MIPMGIKSAETMERTKIGVFSFGFERDTGKVVEVGAEIQYLNQVNAIKEWIRKGIHIDEIRRLYNETDS